MILFYPKNIHYLVNADGQYAADYYGMKYELMAAIVYRNIRGLNDDHTFAESKLQDLVTESKTVFTIQTIFTGAIPKKLINLLDMAIYTKYFLLYPGTLLYRRYSVQLTIREMIKTVI